MANIVSGASLARSPLELIFPPRCVNCHTLGAPLCSSCRATIAIPQPPLCARCGRSLLTPRVDQQCDLCASGRGLVHPTSLRAATVYDGAIRAAILAYKFRGARRLAEPQGQRLAEAYKRERLAADLVTHAPLPSTRHRQRGYDQTQLLARETARRLGLAFLPDAVKRVRATEAQTHLAAERRANVAQAFALANASVIERIKDRRVLLIDKLTSTSNTLDATAAALVEARPAAIVCLALSRPNASTFS
jgi:predicted amidophosphoribosyltransferase